jgi:hypothetical protein
MNRKPKPRAQMAARPKTENEPSRAEACLAALLLRITPADVFGPFMPGITEDDDAHFVVEVWNKVETLWAQIDDANDGSLAFREYRERLRVCVALMNGNVSAPPSGMWDRFTDAYGRGIYQPQGTPRT